MGFHVSTLLSAAIMPMTAVSMLLAPSTASGQTHTPAEVQKHNLLDSHHTITFNGGGARLIRYTRKNNAVLQRPVSSRPRPACSIFHAYEPQRQHGHGYRRNGESDWRLRLGRFHRRTWIRPLFNPNTTQSRGKHRVSGLPGEIGAVLHRIRQ